MLSFHSVCVLFTENHGHSFLSFHPDLSPGNNTKALIDSFLFNVGGERAISASSLHAKAADRMATAVIKCAGWRIAGGFYEGTYSTYAVQRLSETQLNF